MLVTVSVAAASAREPAAPAAQTANPLEGVQFFVDQESPSWQQWQSYRASGQTAKADLIWRIAREPKSLWVGRFTRPNFAVKVRRIFDAAAQWHPPRALTYARYATDWERPPPGTRYGHAKRYPLGVFGIPR